MTIQPYQQRVIEEHKELEDKLARLNEFIDNHHNGKSCVAVSASDLSLLVQQRNAMHEYASVLKKRIVGFNIDGVVK